MIDLHAPRINHAAFAVLYWALVAGAAALTYWYWPVGLVCLAIGLYAGFVEPRMITIASYTEPLGQKMGKRVRIVFLSDLHAGPFKGEGFFRRVAQMTREQKPDLVIMGGDAVEEEVRFIDRLAPLATIEAPLGKYFLLGNHDYVDDPHHVAERFRAWGFQSVENRAVTLEGCELMGLSDPWFAKPDLALLRQRSALVRLLILHEPDNLLDVKRGDAELILLGHTHGGQVRLPLVGSVRRLPQNAPQWLDRGRKVWEGIPVIIGQGLGEADARVRLFCPPQIVVVDIVV